MTFTKKTNTNNKVNYTSHVGVANSHRVAFGLMRYTEQFGISIPGKYRPCLSTLG